MLFQVDDGTVPVMPDFLRMLGLSRHAFPAQDLRMDPRYQHFLVVGAVENADPSALRQGASGAPKKVVTEFVRTRVLEAEHLAALGIDARHHMLDRSVLSRRVHGLK